MVPELERERGVLLGVLAHVHGWQLPEFLLRVDAEVLCGLLQALLGLGLFEIVKAQAVERVAEAVLVQERRSEHRVDDAAIDREA